MVRRSRLIVFLISFILLGIIINLFCVAYRNPAQTVTAAQSKWTVTVSTTRGTIYDSFLVPLVNAETEYKASYLPNISILSTLKNHTTDKNFAYITNAMRNRAPIVVPLTQPLQAQEGLLCFSTRNRYGERLLAPHIIGYCQGENGVSGIEQACDEILQSYGGKLSVTYEVGGGKQYLNGVEPHISDTTEKSVGGVVLSINKTVQSVVEETVTGKLTKGAVVVMDPRSGAVVACASFPSYQPQSVSQSVLDNDGALINRALSLYDCGSVFKVITAAAALEHGVSEKQSFECSGSIDIGGTVFHCHNRNGHGTLNMTEAFSVSCNTYFIQLAQIIGADALYSVANAFGFDRKISLAGNMTAAKPLLPDRVMLEQPAALANLSFGQGYLMTTPLHIAQIISAVANNGAMPPVRLLEGYVDENKNITKTANQPSYTVILSKNARLLQTMLQAVVENGTGKSAKPESCTAAGKTGTAETGQYSDGIAVVQSWFAGYYPAESPQYVVVVLAEDANNTKENASSLFCEISNNLYKSQK